MMVASIMLFGGCGGEEPAVVEDPNAAVLTLMSDQIMVFKAEGGEGVITYTLEHPSMQYNLVVDYDNSDCLTDVNYALMGKITFRVQPNTTPVERDAVIRAKYGDQSFSVRIMQAGNDPKDEAVKVEANDLWGTYTDDGRFEGSAIYWVILSRDGFDDSGAAVANSNYYRMELIAPARGEGEKLIVPDGTYTYDSSNSMYDYTFTGINSCYLTLDSNMTSTIRTFDEASLTVAGNSLTLDAVVDGVRHYVSFNQEYELVKQEPLPDQISTLRGDVEVDFNNTTVYAQSYGDYWKCGYCNWWIEVMPDGNEWNGVNLILDLIATSPDASGGFEGRYVASGFTDETNSEPMLAPGTFVSGVRVSAEGHLLGSLYLVYRDDALYEQAPLTTGSFEIWRNEDGTHSFTLEAYDDAQTPNKITATWTGKIVMR